MPPHTRSLLDGVSHHPTLRATVPGLKREEISDYHSFLSVIFGPVKTKPYLIEEHDAEPGVMSSAEAGLGIAIGAEAFGYSFGNRVANA
jgi:hypothetical protein